MDNLQKIEQLVSKAGCSYEDAKAALEGCGWDMIDAIISLEREGKVKKETVEHTAQNEEAQAEIVAEVITEDRPDSDRQIDYSYEESTSVYSFVNGESECEEISGRDFSFIQNYQF